MAINIRKNGAKFRQIFAAITVNILSVNNGISAGWTSPVQPALQQENNPIQREKITEDEFSWATSMLYLGGFLGLIVWNDFADRFGRKINGYILAITQIVSWLGVIFAAHPNHLILARFIMGFGGSGIMINSQLYINETADPQIKGYLCSLLTIGMNFGSLLVYVLGSMLSYQSLNYFCLCVPVLFLFMYWSLPESPLYLVVNERNAKARSALLWFNGDDIPAAEDSLATLRKSTHLKEKNVPYSEIVSTKDNALLTLVAVVLLSGMQLCGMPSIGAYMVHIFDLTQIEFMSSHTAAIVLGFLLLFVSCVSGYIVKCAGRKLLLSGSYLGAFCSLLTLAAFFFDRDSFVRLNLQCLPLLSIGLLAVCFGAGIGTVPYIVFPDMIPARILNNVVSVALMTAIFISFGVLKVFPLLKSSIGEASTFAIFGANNLLLALFVIYVVPNAKNANVSAEEQACKRSKYVLSVNVVVDSSKK